MGTCHFRFHVACDFSPHPHTLLSPSHPSLTFPHPLPHLHIPPSPPYPLPHLHTHSLTSIPTPSPPYPLPHLHTHSLTSIPTPSPPYPLPHLHTHSLTSIPTPSPPYPLPHLRPSLTSTPYLTFTSFLHTPFYLIVISIPFHSSLPSPHSYLLLPPSSLFPHSPTPTPLFPTISTVQELVEHPYETKSDSFYFVDNKLVMHNKADYAYIAATSS